MEQLRLEYIPLDVAMLWENNKKRHDIGALIRSFQRHGYKDPAKFEPTLNNEKGGIAEGNGRFTALDAMRRDPAYEPPRGIVVLDDGTWTVPVLFGVDSASEAAAEAYAIDHNALVLSGGDFDLTDHLRLWEEGFADDLSVLLEAGEVPTVFDAEDVEALMAMGKELLPAPEPQLNRADELQEKWQVNDGDTWRIDTHFVTCGDCREPETWARLLAAAGVAEVNGVFTSPPYAEQRKEQYGGVPVAEYVDWWEAVQANVRANLAEDGSFFVNIKPHCEDGERALYVFDLVLAMRRRWGWRFVDEVIWKHGGTPGKPSTRFKNQFEPVYVFSAGEYKWRPDNCMFKSDSAFTPAGRPNVSRNQGKGGSTLDGVETFEGMVYPGNVIDIGKNQDAVGHAAAFPVALPTFFVKAYSDTADVWLDPFLGSGTTIVAAHQNDRRGLGIEKLEKYVAVTLERLSEMNLEPERL